MKTLRQVEEALSQNITRETFEAPLKNIDGFDYVAWNDSNRLANKVFGFMGWSSTVESCDYVETEIEVYNRKENAYETKRFKGFRSIVRVTVQVWDEEHQMPISSHHDGVGFANITPMGQKNPMDTASKAAKSDGISTAFKHYGDYFGLFLYNKETPAAQIEGNVVEGSVSTTTTARISSGGDLGPRPSDGQKRGLYQIGLSDEQIASIDFKTWKEMLDCLWSKDSTKRLTPQQILDKYGLAGTPQPTQRRSYPFTRSA